MKKGMGFWVWALGWMLAANATATDLTTGYSFSSGEQNVTHTKLNNAVNNAVINSSFFTDKSAVTAPAAADLALIYSASAAGLRKVSLGNLIYANPFTITNQTADATPASGDFLLTYDVSAESLKKATLLATVFENDNLINARTNWSTPASNTFFLSYDGAWNKIARSNLWYLFWNYRTSDYTNLATHTSPTNLDALVLWDSVSGTNRQLPLINLVSNHAPATALGSTNVLLGVAGTNLATFSLNTLSNYWRTNLALPVFTSASTSMSGLTAGVQGTEAHGLGATPKDVRGVLVCTTTDLGYAVGDEVPFYGVTYLSGGHIYTPMTANANATSVFAVLPFGVANLSILHKTTGVSTVITASSWSMKFYAWP